MPEVMNIPVDTESSQEEFLEASQAPGLRTKHRRTVTLVAGLLAMCAAISFWHYPSVSAKFKAGSFTGLDEAINDTNDTRNETDAGNADGVCDDLPFMKLEELISSNLAKQGPDYDKEEGLIYRASLHHVGTKATSVEIHIRTLSSFDVTEANNESYDKNYRPMWTKGDYVNGICGNFACINLKPGESVKLRAVAKDVTTNKSIQIPRGVISFFDLDCGPKSIEHVKATGFNQYYLSNETEVNVTVNGTFTTFVATKPGGGEDNPTDPLELNQLQKNRAVTIEYVDVPYFDFEVGTSAGSTGRVFTFVFRPSLLCAKTKMPDGSLLPARGDNAPIVPLPGLDIPTVHVDDSDASKGLPSACLMLACVAILTQSLM